jgi:hypothetical protein
VEAFTSSNLYELQHAVPKRNSSMIRRTDGCVVPFTAAAQCIYVGYVACECYVTASKLAAAAAAADCTHHKLPFLHPLLDERVCAALR